MLVVGKGGLPPLTSNLSNCFFVTPQTMARKWSNRNLPGALHFATGNFQDRVLVFTRDAACQGYIDVIANKRQEWPFKLVAYVLMPDHFHLIVNPRDGRIRELMGALKSLSAQAIVHAVPDLSFRLEQPKPNQSEHQVWAGELQGPVALERLDDLAEDQLHRFQSCQSRAGQVSG